MVNKIGFQILHHDEYLTLKAMLAGDGIEVYAWTKHNFDKDELATCDLLVLFGRRHWRYLKFDKPYLLILADYVSNKKAVLLTKQRRLGIFGFSYHPNQLFKAFLCGSSELYETILRSKISAFFYLKKYPFADIFQELQKTYPENKRIVTLINDYKRTARKLKWRKPTNCFKVYQKIVSENKNFDFDCYGFPNRQLSFEESNVVQFNARYTLHIKYWGHVCNAVVKSLALGTPVIMDEETFLKGRYQAYIRHGENGLVFKNQEDINRYLQSREENTIWQKLSHQCLKEAPTWHFPYLSDELADLKTLLSSL